MIRGNSASRVRGLKQLGVVDTASARDQIETIQRQDHRSGDHRTGPRAAPGFVQPGDMRKTLVAQSILIL